MDTNSVDYEPKGRAASRKTTEVARDEGVDITDEQIEDLSGGASKIPIKPRRDSR